METEWIFNLFDLLRDMWDSTSSAFFNLRSIINFVSTYLASELELTPMTKCRMREGPDIKRILMDLLFLWTQKGPLSLDISKDVLCKFLNEYRYIKDAMERVIISAETYHDWLRDYKEYLKKNNNEAVTVYADNKKREKDIGTIEMEAKENEKKEGEAAAAAAEEEETGDGGLDSLFNSSASWKKNKECEDGSSVYQQYITKLESDGRLSTLKTPGETGKELVRLYVYDVKDIAKVDKRNWWRYAKLRTQFFSPLATRPNCMGNRKRSLLRQLLDETADELKNLSGATMETSRVDFFGNN